MERAEYCCVGCRGYQTALSGGGLFGWGWGRAAGGVGEGEEGGECFYMSWLSVGERRGDARGVASIGELHLVSPETEG